MGDQVLRKSRSLLTGQKEEYLGFKGLDLKKNLKSFFIKMEFSKSKKLKVKKFIELLIEFTELVLAPSLNLLRRKSHTKFVDK